MTHVLDCFTGTVIPGRLARYGARSSDRRNARRLSRGRCPVLPRRQGRGGARETFRQLQLERRSLVAENRDVHIFLWRGS
jgi:hypothetical protein